MVTVRIKLSYSPINLLSSLGIVTIFIAVAAGDRKLCKGEKKPTKQRTLNERRYRIVCTRDTRKINYTSKWSISRDRLKCGWIAMVKGLAHALIYEHCTLTSPRALTHKECVVRTRRSNRLTLSFFSSRRHTFNLLKRLTPLYYIHSVRTLIPLFFTVYKSVRTPNAY